MTVSTMVTLVTMINMESLMTMAMTTMMTICKEVGGCTQGSWRLGIELLRQLKIYTDFFCLERFQWEVPRKTLYIDVS